MHKNKYIGITIGPIYKFMSMTSTPAGLWGTSYLFSFISKHLCQALIVQGVRVDQFITPALYHGNLEGNTIINPKPGVGLFHDRIIIQQEEGQNITMDEVQACIDSVIELTANGLAAAVSNNLNDVTAYLKDALQIYALEISLEANVNPLLKINSLLDALELQQRFVQEEKINYVLKLMENTGNNGKNRNELVKKSFLVSDFVDGENRYEDWPLTKGNKKNIRDLEQISSGGHSEIDMKKYQYYAVVQADGDNMGKILNSFTNDDSGDIADKIKSFSKCCFDFCIEAVEIANTYGAVTIYTGGDDFLALAPLENIEGKTVFDFISELSASFNKKFEAYEDYSPSLSFGVMMGYYKLPLYESFTKAGALLFEQAKSSEKRNALAFHLQKHSGQSINLKITNMNHDASLFKKMIELLKDHWQDQDNQNNFLKATAHHIYEQKGLFEIAVEQNKNNHDDAILDNVFKNIFDAAYQKDHPDYYDKIKKLTKDLVDHLDDYELFDKSIDSDSKKVISAVDSVLRLMKFFVEPGREEEKS